MQFPVFILGIHPHLFFEILAMFVGARLYFLTRQTNRMNGEQSFIVIIGMIFGSFVFSKLIHILQTPADFWRIFQEPSFFFSSGKTIIGALLGGILGVEAGKKIAHVQTRTGDDFVFPFLIALAIGRLGCFFTGLDDNTYGIVSGLPWAVDFGDGFMRHPVQLYESMYLMILALCLYVIKKSYKLPNGLLFQLMVADYLLFRFLIDFLKPYSRHYLGLDSLQLACLIGLLMYIFIIRDTMKKGEVKICAKKIG